MAHAYELPDGAHLMSSDANGHTIVARRDIVEVLAGVDQGERGRVVGEDGNYVVVELKDGTHLRCSGQNVEIVRMAQTFAGKPPSRWQGGGYRRGEPYTCARCGEVFTDMWGDAPTYGKDGKLYCPTDAHDHMADPEEDEMDSVHVPQREESEMADPRDSKTKMDLTEVSVGADGSVAVTVDPEGDEAREGMMSTFAAKYEMCPFCEASFQLVGGKFPRHRNVRRDICPGADKTLAEAEAAQRSQMSTMSAPLPAWASCPYCSKTVAMSLGALGHHRSATGVCDGSGKSVARVEMGRAVLMADKEYHPVPVGWIVKIEASDGVVRWHRVTSSTSTHVTARPLQGDDRKYGAREVTRPISEVYDVRRSLQ